MTKGEYCKLKGLRVYNPVFNLNDELDDDFKKSVDTLVSNYDDICNEKEDSDI